MEKYSPNSILHLIDSSGKYGAENVILTLLEEMLHSDFPGILGCIRENDAEVPTIGKEAQSIGIPVKYFTMHRGFNIWGIQNIFRFIRDNNIRIVHSHGYKPDIFLRILPKKGMKTISTVHGWAKGTAGIKVKIYERLNLIALNKMDKVVAVSNAVADDLKNLGINKKKISVVYNGIRNRDNQVIYDKSILRKRYGFLDNILVIGAVGRLVEIKGHSYLIKAMPSILREIKSCQLVIAGEGPLSGALKVLIEELNLTKNVQLIGYVQDIKKFLAMIDLFVLPSLSEGLPISLLEAMAYEKPILASAVGGIPEVILNQDEGVLIPHADVFSISKAVTELLKNPCRMNNMATIGKKVVTEKFSSIKMAGQYSIIYSNLIV